MRLPWPFGRSTSGAGSSSAPGGDAASAPSAAPPVVDADLPVPPTGAWRSLPPIQRSSGPPPVVAPAAPFLADVPGHVALPPIVTPLGHDTSPSAPAGIVVAHPHAVPSLTSSAPLSTRPVQRHAASGAPAPLAGPAPDEPSESRPVVARSVDADAAAPEPSPLAVAVPDLPPIRSVAPVAPAATVTPPSRPLTRAAPVLAPLAVAQRSATAPAEVQRSSATARLAPPLQAGRRVPSPSKPAASAAPEGAHAATAPVRRFAELPLDHPGAQARTDTSAPPRRSGLGAPIAAAPPSAVAQRLPMRLGRPPDRPAPSADAAMSDSAAVAAAPILATDEALEAARLPVLPVARTRSADAPAIPAPAALTTTPAPARPTRLEPARATVARSAAVPTMGSRPLRPSVTRASTIALAAAPSGDGSAATDLVARAPVAARWDTAASLPDTITALPAAAHSEREVVPLQLAPSPAAPSAGASPAGPREIVFPAPDDAPGLASTFVTPASTPAVIGRPSPASHPMQPLTLARSVAPAASQAPAPVAQPSSMAPTIARIVADPSSPGAPPVVQTTPGTGIPVATFTATPVVQREESPAPAPQGAGGHSERELDELAKQLFGRIRMQLTSEVIHEREAKGLGFDAF